MTIAKSALKNCFKLYFSRSPLKKPLRFSNIDFQETTRRSLEIINRERVS